MLLALNDVTASDGKAIQINAKLETKVVSFGFGRYPVTDSTPVSLRIQNRGDKKLSISGKATVELRIPCDRCLADVSVSLPLEIEREVDMGLTEEERRKALDEQSFIEGYDLNVDRLVLNEILLDWPAKVLCRPDCRGLCPTCGINLNHETCSCSSETVDPRMEKIQKIFQEFKEV